MDMVKTAELTRIDVGLGTSINPMKRDTRFPQVFLSLVKNHEGKVAGFQVKPENDLGHCWCTNLLQGLRGCTFTANILTGSDSIIIENEIVDAGRLSWIIASTNDMQELKDAIHPIHVKGEVGPYLVSRLGGDDDLPYFDGFAIVNKEMVKILAEPDDGE